jgi:hypothetical protein
MSRIVCILAIFFVLPGTAKSQEEMRDPWQVAERLLESLGGQERWAGIEALYVREIAWPSGIDGPVTAEFWRGLSQPEYRSLFVGENLQRATYWSPASGWRERDGVRAGISRQDLESEIADWRQEPYVMYHKLAVRDQGLELRIPEPDRLEIYDSESGALLCWFVVDMAGALLRWGNYYRGEIHEHVYGPIRQFGELRMPAWGTSTTGNWRFEYRDVRPIATSAIADTSGQ